MKAPAKPAGSPLRRISLTARRLMRNNWLVLLLLLFWPCVLSMILLAASGGRPAADDARAILQQEWLYGLILVALGSSTALGTEMRARRLAGVLGRALGRTEYLLALALSAFLPFLGYVAVLALNATVLEAALRIHVLPVTTLLAAELAGGVLSCALGLLFSVLFSQLLAGIAAALVLGGLLGAARAGYGGAVTPFAVVLAGAQVPGGVSGLPGALFALGIALLCFGVSASVFNRRDLRV